ncbi:hypothetical protein SAY86_005986 [Trapa natans]|uniref:RRM domain-containing protein n=1 Tax=Trapa natans TaxID=22666 RepID=A0AAN7QX83_TRANT|nr:hypothetical protein SAY86_005986 [Trapa natans]
MPPPSKPTKPSYHGAGKDSGDHSAPPSNTLWVGNLTGEVTDEVLIDMFKSFEPLHATSYGSRGYGFIFFRRTEDSVAAKDSLHGSVLKGSSIKIEFARPAKACKHIWIGGISTGLSKEHFEEEFAKFGKIDEFKFVRERNVAAIEYARLEDAIQAMRSMNGKDLDGEQLRVDFVRLQPIRRENWADGSDTRDYPGRGIGPSDVHAGSKRSQPSHSSGFRRDGHPSNILWVGYPPSVQMDEQKLHNAMILFGEIERMKSFPTRNYSFVEFRSADEARRAKEGLQGRLFNDPRITIMFSHSGLAPDRGPEMYGGEHFLAPQIEVYNHSHPFGADIPLRPFGPHSSYDPHAGPEFDEVDRHYGAREGSGKILMGSRWGRRSPPTSAIFYSSPSVRTSSGCDVYEANQFQRDSKRSRIESSLPGHETPFPSRMIDDHRLGMNRSYGHALDGTGPGISSNHGGNQASPLVSRFSPEPVQESEDDYIWRGLIAKGGTPVCHARCIPIGEGLSIEIPETVNCSARTGLDTLEKHYEEAAGFDLVFFLPDSEEDFGSYTEFLRYLASKDRAGVAKLSGGTTLFLIPPSDFLQNVLKVVGPERLYGVVLRMSRSVHNTESHPTVTSLQYADRLQYSSLSDRDLISPRMQPPVMGTDYGQIAHADSKMSKPTYHPLPTEAPAVHSSLPNYGSTSTASNPEASQKGIIFTPELIASLASLIPTNQQTPTTEVPQQQNYRPQVDATQPESFRPLIPLAAPRSNYQVPEYAVTSNQQLPASQFIHPVSSLPIYQSYPSVVATPSHSLQPVFSRAQMHDSSANAYQQAQIPSTMTFTSFPVPHQTGHVVASAQINQQHQLEATANAQKGCEVVQGIDVSRLYSTPALNNASSVTVDQVPGASGFPQLQAVMPSVYERTTSELSNQVQQHQASSEAFPNKQEVDEDKNKRYQSTLQFAASLLQQIHQKPQ